MKTYFPSKELPHLWAHELAPMGRGPGNISFNGACFLSYRTVIARITRHAGKRAYIVDDRSYSVTTAKHRIMVARAIPDGSPVFHYEQSGMGGDLHISPRELFDYALARAANSGAKASRARAHRDLHLSDCHGWLNGAESVAKFYGKRWKVNRAAVSKHSARIAAAHAESRKAARERGKIAEQKKAAALTDWLSGASNYFPASISRCYLRRAADTVQTSRGVTIPADDARKAIIFCRAHRAAGWHRNGEQFPVGQYQLDSISESGVIAGCHRFDWETLENFAVSQDW